jgi:mannose-6-phosphate isomerase-like protein (cupin superfamily)
MGLAAELKVAKSSMPDERRRDVIMLRKGLYFLAVMAAAAASVSCVAQTYGPAVDTYFGDWHGSPVKVVYGTLREQDVLAPGDALHPKAKGAVLATVKSFRHASLAAKAATTAIQLKGVQQIYFVESGSGEAKAGGETVKLTRGCALLAPEGVTLTLRNTGSTALTMYVIEEPVGAGFHPKTELVLKDANKMPYATNHEEWSYVVKPVLTAADGLATLGSVEIVEMGALTIGRPKLTQAGRETVWTTLSGTPLEFVANELRHQPVGTAFMEVPDGKTPHSAIDPSENAPASFLVFESGAK